ncbi:MAG: hypothetical protein DMF63_16315 [Acidobacteria bacterium]|nr:MAG: hypothetical protein DMF63_16315 [Acidobacteriota bacterium]
MTVDDREDDRFVWLPTANQELLLKAGLVADSSAIDAWLAWRELVAGNEISEAESRILPLVYHNLQKLEFQDDLSAILKRKHRSAFKKVHTHLSNAEMAIKILSAHGVAAILLKGGAVGTMYYESAALRPMSDIDLLIKPEDFAKATEVLSEAGWDLQCNNPKLALQVINSCDFKNSAGEELDIHWRLMRDCWNADKNDLFWSGAVELEYKSLRTKTLCTTDHLFHVCCHGARQNSLSPIRWVADAIMILRSHNEVDWQRLYRLGKLYRLSLTLFHALAYLKEGFDAPIPEEYFKSIRDLPISRLERLSFTLYSQPFAEWGWKRYAEEIALQYSMQRSGTDLRPKTIAFVKYFQFVLESENVFMKSRRIFTRLLLPQSGTEK